MLFLKAYNISNTMLIIGLVLLAFSGVYITLLGVLFTLPSLLFGPVVLVIGVIMIIAGAIRVCRKGLNLCLTDKRIISFGVNYLQDIPLEDVVSTKVVAGKGNKGKLIIKAKIDQNSRKCANYVFPDVEDYRAVKYRLDQAIEKCKADQF